jgi:hypothetical protein
VRGLVQRWQVTGNDDEGVLPPRRTEDFAPRPVFHKRAKDRPLPSDLSVLGEALKTPPDTLPAPENDVPTPDCGRTHGRCALAAEPGPRSSTRRSSASYGWFTEGFDTRDLKEAKALLEELAA